MKKFFYIILFTGFSLTGYSQLKPALSQDLMKVVKLYPNPAVNYVNFEFDNVDRSGTIVIYNFIGKKVEEVKVNDPRLTISVNDFYRGVYIYQLRNSQGVILQSGKFQVSR